MMEGMGEQGGARVQGFCGAVGLQGQRPGSVVEQGVYCREPLGQEDASRRAALPREVERRPGRRDDAAHAARGEGHLGPARDKEREDAV